MEKWVEILEEIEKQSSSKQKIQLLELGINTYPELEKFLKMTFVSNKVLNIDSKTIEKALSIDTKQNFVDIGEKIKWYLNNGAKNKSLLDIGKKKFKTFDNFIELYNKLTENRGMLIKTLLNNFFLNCDENDAKWYARCLCKDLHSGFSVRTVNKALIRCDKKIISKFSMQLAVALGNDNIREKVEKIIVDNKGEVFQENKEDGARMMLRNTNPVNIGIWEALSRNGKSIMNVDNLLYEANRIFGITPCELDGELVADDFYSLSKTLHSKNDTAAIIPRTFQIFDILRLGSENVASWSYRERKQLLIENIPRSSLIFKVIKNHNYNTVDDIMDYFDRQVEKGEEGIIIKNNAPYTYKRENWYKLKPVHTLDLEIIGFEYAEDGKWSGERSVLIIKDLNGNLISKVGSGLKDSDIELFNMGKESDWIGKIVEVKMDSITPQSKEPFKKAWVKPHLHLLNKEGVKSLRFPRFVKLRDDKDVADIV